MNFADTELVLGILKQQGYFLTKEIGDAGIILLNTCSIRDNAEQKIYARLVHLKGIKKIIPELLSVFLAVWLNVLEKISSKRKK